MLKRTLGRTGLQVIRVNRQPVARDYVLIDGDRVSANHLCCWASAV